MAVGLLNSRGVRRAMSNVMRLFLILMLTTGTVAKNRLRFRQDRGQKRKLLGDGEPCNPASADPCSAGECVCKSRRLSAETYGNRTVEGRQLFGAPAADRAPATGCTCQPVPSPSPPPPPPPDLPSPMPPPSPKPPACTWSECTVDHFDIGDAGYPTSSSYGGFYGGFSSTSHSYYAPRLGRVMRIAHDDFSVNSVEHFDLEPIHPNLKFFSSGCATDIHAYFSPRDTGYSPRTGMVVRIRHDDFSPSGVVS